MKNNGLNKRSEEQNKGAQDTDGERLVLVLDKLDQLP
jgi:hypothetical protein